MNDATVHELYAAIRKHCLECSGGSIKGADGCRIEHCNLHPYRMREGMKINKKTIKLKGQIGFNDLLKG